MLTTEYNDLRFINSIRSGVDWLNVRVAFVCGMLFTLDGTNFKDIKAKFVVATFGPREDYF
jgi:hypothetical protein